jgi:hypothetical protein
MVPRSHRNSCQTEYRRAISLHSVLMTLMIARVMVYAASTGIFLSLIGQLGKSSYRERRVLL